MDDEEWDLAAIDELERIAQEAIAAKRASQMPPPLLPSAGSSFVDAWDAGALGMDLQHSSPLQNGDASKMESPKVRSQKQEIDRLATELAFKDQEVLDAKRACVEKDEQLKKAMASFSALQKELEALKGGIKGALDPVSVLKARISSSPGCATGTPVSSAAPDAQETPFRQSTMTEPELSCKLQHVWEPVNQEAAGNDVLRYILATCGTELHALQSFERCNEVDRCGDSCNSTSFCKTLSSVSCGSSPPFSLVDPLMKFLHFEDGSIIWSSLHVLRTLLQVDYVSKQATLGRCTSAKCHGLEQITAHAYKLQVQAEVKGCGWSFYPKNLQLPGGGSRLMFCSPRLICKFKEAGVATNFHDDVHAAVMEEPRELIFMLLRLSANGPDPALRYEALSIIMLLLLEADALVGRFWIGSLLLEGGISCLLRRSAGSDIQLCVVKLAHLLFNCPDLLSRLCTTNCDGDTLVRAGQELFVALRGCLTHNGNSSEDCVLRKYALQTLAMVAEAGDDGVAALMCKIGVGCSKSVSNISAELISLLDLLLNEEENQGRFDKMDGLSDERLRLMQETLLMLSKLLLDPVHGMTFAGFLTTDAETSRRSLDVANRLVKLASSRPGRKGDLLNLGKGLRSKILGSLTRSDPPSKSYMLTD